MKPWTCAPHQTREGRFGYATPFSQAKTPQEHGIKRRATKFSAKSHQQRVKTEGSPEKRTHDLLQEMAKIDQNIGEPKEIYQQFLDRCRTVDEDVARSLVRLFYMIASPQAFDQLREACTLVRVEGEITIAQKTDTAAQTISAFNALNTAAMVHSIPRRFHLVRLHEHRAERDQRHDMGRLAPTLRQTRKARSANRQALQKFTKSASLALADLMTEAYPHLEKPTRIQDAVGTEYGKRYSTLKHMLAAGRNWRALQQAFSTGVLALVPTGSEAGMQNPEIERVPAAVFDTFVDILVELRGDFIKRVSTAMSHRISDVLYRRDLQSRCKFETIDAGILRSHPLDAPVLVDLCSTE